MALEPDEELPSSAPQPLGGETVGRLFDRFAFRQAGLAPIAAWWLASALGCNSSPPPWEQPTGGSPPVTTSARPQPDEEPLPTTTGERLEAGGIFTDCYAAFQSSGDAIKDVTRLGLVCGPVAGMRRAVEAPYEGAISEGSAELDFPLPLVKGTCYRLFVAPESPALVLDVSVVSSHGLPIATGLSKTPWIVVQADRPFCALGEDAATIRVGAKSGSGRFALDVWSMP